MYLPSTRAMMPDWSRCLRLIRRRVLGRYIEKALVQLALECLRYTPDVVKVLIDEHRAHTRHLRMHGIIDHSAAPVPSHAICPEHRHAGTRRICRGREHPERLIHVEHPQADRHPRKRRLLPPNAHSPVVLPGKTAAIHQRPRSTGHART